jgi:RNA polymerase sigma-B factor
VSDGEPSDEQAESFRRYRRSGSLEDRNRLVVDHTALADALARRFAGRGEPDDDLRQVARLALVRVVERYDPDRGVPFRSFAVPSIVGELKRHFRDRTWAVSVSRTLRDLGPAVRAADEDLRARGVERPTVDDLADHLGVAPESVLEAMEAARSRRTAAWEPERSGERPPPESDPGDLVADRAQVAELLGRLGDRDRLIVVLAFYRDWTQQRIADAVGLSQEQVSRVLRSALAALRTPHRGG